MLKKAMEIDGKNWGQLLPHVLFTVREVPQASTGFSPFKLLYGRKLRGLLDLAKDAWESQPSPHRTLVDHVKQVRDRLAQVWPIARWHLQQALQAQAWVYNRVAQLCIFQPGELVLVLIPTAECMFLAMWQEEVWGGRPGGQGKLATGCCQSCGCCREQICRIGHHHGDVGCAP